MIPGGQVVLDLYLEEERAWFDASRPQARTLAGGWRASQLGTCLQAQIRERYGEPATRRIDAATRRAFAWGDHIEDFYRTIHQRAGVVVATQVPLRDEELDLSGHVDLVLRFPPASVDEIPLQLRQTWSEDWLEWLRYLRDRVQALGGQGCVAVEVKSTHSRSLPYLLREGARFAHEVQVGAYMLMARRHPDQLPCRVDRWRIDYLGKDSVGVVSIPVLPRAAEIAHDRVASLNRYVAEEREPADVPCSCEGWEVEYCRYSEALEPGPDGPRFRCCDGTTYQRRWKPGEKR